MNSFTTRFIIRSSVVIFVVFLTIYFLFNRVADDFIKNTAEPDLTMQIHNNNAEYIAIFGNGWRSVSIEDAMLIFLHLPTDATPRDSLALALLSDTSTDNQVIINERGVLMTSENILNQNLDFLQHNNISVDKRAFLADYYQEHRELFYVGETVPVEIGDQVFFLRSVATDHLEDQAFPTPPSPLTILLYTEVTEMLTFKNTVNQILIITLSLSGLIILTMTVRMSTKFKQSIRKLANYAKEIGHGSFNAEIESFKYSEFQTLASSMTDMSNMLAIYEVNQKQFFQNASHELRTPLMAVQCYSEGILADVFEPSEAATIINGEIEKMTELVSSILYLSRINHHTIQLKPTSINEALTNCHNQIKILIDNNNKTIRFDPLKQDIQINIDPQLFERAILNILSNALRYVKTEITIVAEKSLRRNIFANIKQDMVRISITNDGEKIDKKDLPHLFERFYKGDDGNTGLGLSITKEIITNFGGTVKVENLDGGVCFMIELPIG